MKVDFKYRIELWKGVGPRKGEMRREVFIRRILREMIGKVGKGEIERVRGTGVEPLTPGVTL
jgi:predicted PP-loop superfamily ATPase